MAGSPRSWRSSGPSGQKRSGGGRLAPVAPRSLPPNPRGRDFGHCPQVGSAPGPHPFGGEGSNACLRRDEPPKCGRPKKRPKATR